jgi:peptidoglycan hydrolase-like protein with peptidoglycan-binding domain
MIDKKSKLKKGGGQMDKIEFISSIKEGALEGFSQHKILPSLTIAQAILESAWGSSELTRKANNLFGVKASPAWTGKKITMKTAEWYRGERQLVDAEFRYYDSLGGSIEDHNILLSQSRYKSVRECEHYIEASKKIYQCGYATDPAYPEKLIKIIEENRLYEFDKMIEAGQQDKIRSFQKLCNELGIKDNKGKPLIEDNLLGERTLSCLKKMPVLKLGSRGKAVEFVQKSLNALPVDGVFGAVTSRNVMEYQKAKNIEVDGIVGINTWTSLIIK